MKRGNEQDVTEPFYRSNYNYSSKFHSQIRYEDGFLTLRQFFLCNLAEASSGW